MVRIVDLMLVPPLVALFGSDMIANGAMVIAASSSRKNLVVGKSSLAGVGIPLRANVVFEPVRETRARPIMARALRENR